MEEKGTILLQILISFIIISVIGATCLKLIHFTSKDLHTEIIRTELESETSKAVASIYSASHNAPDIFGLSFHVWRNSSESLPEYIQSEINKISKQHSLKSDSAFLESVELRPNLLLKQHKSSDSFQGNIPSSQINTLRSQYVIGINPHGIFRINNTQSLNWITNDLWSLNVISSSSIEKVLNQSLNTRSDAKTFNTQSINMVLPLLDHFLLYVSNSKELRRFSLIKNENQSITLHTLKIDRTGNSCVLAGERKHIKVIHEFPCYNREFNSFLIMDFLDLGSTA